MITRQPPPPDYGVITEAEKRVYLEKLRDEFAGKALPLSAKHFASGHIDGWDGIAKLKAREL